MTAVAVFQQSSDDIIVFYQTNKIYEKFENKIIFVYSTDNGKGKLTYYSIIR